jgi:hypothetical protein
VFWKCLLLGLSIGSPTLLHNRPSAWILAGCKQARRFPSLVPRAAGASKSQKARRRASCNPNLQSWKSTGRMMIYARSQPATTIQAAGVDARAEISYGQGVVFHVNDRWNVTGPVLSAHRTVTVTGSAPGGFYSSVMLTVDPAVSWPDVNYMVPAGLYGDPAYDGDQGADCYSVRPQHHVRRIAMELVDGRHGLRRQGLAHGPGILARRGGTPVLAAVGFREPSLWNNGLEGYDSALFKRLSTKPAAAANMPAVNE